MTLRYAERAPSAPLAAFVRCIWCLESPPGSSPPPPDRVLPDGCPEIVVHFAADFGVTDAGGPRTQHRVVFAGQLLTALELRPSGTVGLLGVRFHPGAAGPYLGVAMSSLTGAGAPLGDLVPGLARDLADAACTAHDAAARLAAAERVLAPRARSRVPGTLVADAVRAIERERGEVRIADVIGMAEGGGVSGRTLERRFLDDCGIAAKTFARIVRFRRAAQMLRAGGMRAVDVSVRAGFSDQAHFTREFTEFAGDPPLRWLRREHELAEPFLASPADPAR